LEGVPDVVKGAIERSQAKAALPGRLPAPAPVGGRGFGAEWSAEEKRYGAMLRQGTVPTDTWKELALMDRGRGDDAHRHIAMMRAFGQYSPASKAYSEVPEDQRYHSMSEFICDVFETKPGAQWKGVNPRLKTAFAEGAGATGSFLVPEEFRAEVYALEIEADQFEPLATTLPMASMQLRVPTILDTTHVGSVFGGITGFWEAEAATLQESEPTFDMIQLNAKKLTLYTVASNEILNDGAISLEALIRQRYPQAAAWYRSTAWWNGTGAGNPQGILTAPAAYAQAKESGQAAATILYENIVNMYSHMLPTSHARAVWFVHPNVLPQLATMALSVGTGGGPIFVQFGGAQNAFPYTIFGRPVIVSEHMATLGTQGDIAYCDLSYYLIGRRQDLSFEVSQHVKFINDQTVWRFIERLDGRPWIASTLTLEHGSFQVSPFVLLATRS
jgi:HK97 family phage major capsid protein